MSGLGGMWQVALREVRERGRSKPYLITTGALLLLVVALIVIPQVFEDETEEISIGLVGTANGQIVDAAQALGNAGDEPGELPSVAIDTTEYADRQTAVSDLEAGRISAVLVDGEELIVERGGGSRGGSSVVSLLQRGAATVALEEIVAEEGKAAESVIELMTSDSLETTSLTDEGPEEEAREVVAYAGLLLLYGAILFYGSWILNGVTEEKTNRVVEVLLSSIRPWQLLGGKILGIGTLGIAQFVGTIAVTLIAIEVSGVFDLPPLDVASVMTPVLWFILGFLLFAVMFGAAGSLVSRSEDAQNVAFPMSMVAVAGFFLSIVTLDDPDGVGALVGTFIPLTAPFVVPVRSALEAIPVWQYAVSVLLTMGMMVAMVYVGGRIYAGGLLRFGGKTGIREAWRGATD